MAIRLAHPSAHIVHVLLDNPSRLNALTLEMFECLARLWPELEQDDTVRAIVVSGVGRAFCTGADLSSGLPARRDIDDLVDRALLKTALFPKPLIAAINGACVAGGLELALAADIRITSNDASIGLPEVRWGIVPSGGGAMKLADQIGHAKAMDLLLTGRLVNGVEAERIGLVSEAVPAANVLSRAFERAAMVAANSPVAVCATKCAAFARKSALYRQAEIHERALLAEVRRSGHPAIGMQAFLERSAPDYADEDLHSIMAIARGAAAGDDR